MRSFLHFTGLCIPTSLLDNLSSLTALLRALDDLDALFESIEDAYKASLMHDKIVLWDERRQSDDLRLMSNPRSFIDLLDERSHRRPSPNRDKR